MMLERLAPRGVGWVLVSIGITAAIAVLASSPACMVAVATAGRGVLWRLGRNLQRRWARSGLAAHGAGDSGRLSDHAHRNHTADVAQSERAVHWRAALR
jgi:hypothetical protein